MKKVTYTKGATMVEYGILIALIGILNVAELKGMSDAIQAKFTEAQGELALGTLGSPINVVDPDGTPDTGDEFTEVLSGSRDNDPNALTGTSQEVASEDDFTTTLINE